MNHDELIKSMKDKGITVKVDNGNKLEFSNGETYVKDSHSGEYKKTKNYMESKMDIRKLVESKLFNESELNSIEDVSNKLTSLGIDNKIDNDSVLVYVRNSVITVGKYGKRFTIFRNGNIVAKIEDDMLYSAWDLNHNTPVKFTKSGFKKLTGMY